MKTLRELVAMQAEIDIAARKLWALDIEPNIAKCDDLAEFQTYVSRLQHECSDVHGQFKGFPPFLQVQLLEKAQEFLVEMGL